MSKGQGSIEPVSDDAWSPWEPHELAGRLRHIASTWYVVGGWALDLWYGHPTREHEDLEFAVLADDVGTFRQALGELDFFAVHAGVVEHLAPDTLPPSHVAQLWGLDSPGACWRVDMMVEKGTPSTWVYKRDPGISARRSNVVRIGEAGIPYLAPAAVLLFKAKARREKDEADFRRALPKLSDIDRDMLRCWLARAHPDHEWRRLL